MVSFIRQIKNNYKRMNKIEDLSPGVPVILANGLFPENKKVCVLVSGFVLKIFSYQLN